MLYHRLSGSEVSFTCRVMLIAAIGGIVSCGGGGDSSPVVSNGVLIDSAVEGVAYQTDTQSGVTDANGQFSYVAGETISFSIGDLAFPVIAAGPQITPQDFAAASADPQAMTANIARLLQSLDTNADPADGITISSIASENATAIDLDQSVAAFEADSAVLSLVANSGSTNTSLISEDAALAHLDQTLETLAESENEAPSLADLSGFYDSTVNSIRQHYLQINIDGSAIDYTLQEDGCYDTEPLQFTALGEGLFERLSLATDERSQVRMTREEGDLMITGDDDETVVLPAVTELASTDLALCPGDGTLPVTSGRISTLEAFSATIIGRTLIQREANGSRDETTELVVNSDGTVTGTFDGNTIFIDWYWEGELYCRSGTSGNSASPIIIEFQCQVVTIQNGVATFANSMDEIDARSYFVE